MKLKNSKKMAALTIFFAAFGQIYPMIPRSLSNYILYRPYQTTTSNALKNAIGLKVAAEQALKDFAQPTLQASADQLLNKPTASIIETAWNQVSNFLRPTYQQAFAPITIEIPVSKSFSLPQTPEPTQTPATSVASINNYALGAIAGAALIGATAYGYHLSNQFTQADADQALSFIYNLIQNPYHDTIFKNSNLQGYLTQQQDLVLKVLGLKNALFTVNKYIDVAENSPLKKVLNTEYQEVQKLFSLLEEILDFSDQTDLKSALNTQLKLNIQKQAVKIYGYLLKAQSTLPDEKEKSSEFTTLITFDKAIRSKNKTIHPQTLSISTLDYLLAQKIMTANDKQFDPAQQLLKTDPEILVMLVLFKKYYNNPSVLFKKHATHKEKSDLISQVEDEKYSALETFTTAVRNKKYLNLEKNIINSFFDWVNESIEKPTDALHNRIRNYAQYLMFLSLERLSIDKKIALIQNYLLAPIIQEQIASLPEVPTSQPGTAAPPQAALRQQSEQIALGDINPWSNETAQQAEIRRAEQERTANKHREAMRESALQKITRPEDNPWE